MKLRRTDRTEMWCALAIFAICPTLAVVVNSLVGYGFHSNYSISRYVGLETWSAILFALGNLAVAILMIYYLYRLGERWQVARGYYWLVVVLVIALLGLSACPIGYFDLPGEAYASSSLSIIHEVCSRTLFLAMLVLVVIFALQDQVSPRVRSLGVVFLVYGAICVAGYLLHADWFVEALLFFEATYLLGFMLACLGCGWSNAMVVKPKERKEKYGQNQKVNA